MQSAVTRQTLGREAHQADVCLSKLIGESFAEQLSDTRLFDL